MQPISFDQAKAETSQLRRHLLLGNGFSIGVHEDFGYERHLNWEFTEPELEATVAFLESPAGQHYLEAGGRMTDYIGTNTEPLVEEIVTQARGILARRLAKWAGAGPAPSTTPSAGRGPPPAASRGR